MSDPKTVVFTDCEAALYAGFLLAAMTDKKHNLKGFTGYEFLVKLQEKLATHVEGPLASATKGAIMKSETDAVGKDGQAQRMSDTTFFATKHECSRGFMAEVLRVFRRHGKMLAPTYQKEVSFHDTMRVIPLDEDGEKFLSYTDVDPKTINPYKKT